MGEGPIVIELLFVIGLLLIGFLETITQLRRIADALEHPPKKEPSK